MNDLLLSIPTQVTSPIPWEAIVRLLAAGAMGSIIGLEREHRGRSAGFRTQLLVAVGAALAMLVSLHFADVYNAAEGAVRVDPARIAYGIMGGIGFLGAGAIMRSGAGIRGLTTAASLWCTAAVGLACGFGLYVLAGVATFIVVFALLILTRLDRHIPATESRTVTVEAPGEHREALSKAAEYLKPRVRTMRRVRYESDLAAGVERASFDVSVSTTHDPTALDGVREVDGVSVVRIERSPIARV